MPKSALHEKVKALLRGLYPGYTVLEEHPVKVVVHGRKTTLFVDLVVKELRLAIECQGRQHYQFTPHFHGNRPQFAASVQRDQAKAQALREAGCIYLAVGFQEGDRLTARKLLKRITRAIEET